jgi:hypothetical protein
MDGKRFDAWTRRRAALGIGGLTLGVLAAAAGPAAAAKKKKKKKSKACDGKQKRRCRRDGFGCENGKCVVVCRADNSSCGNNNVIQLCGPQGTCECSRLVGGGFACAAGRPEECPEISECIGNLDCARGEVCVDLSGDACCGESKGICRKVCNNQAPGF